MKMLFNDIPNDVIQIYHAAVPVNDAEKVFVQANDFEKVMKITKFVAAKARTHDDIRLLFGFTMRQAYLYVSACRYLGLVETRTDKTNKTRIYPTKRGRETAKLKYTDRKHALKYLEYMLENECFYRVFEDIVEHESMPGAVRVREIMSTLEVCKPGVINRRASSVISWYRYIFTKLLDNGTKPAKEKK